MGKRIVTSVICIFALTAVLACTTTASLEDCVAEDSSLCDVSNYEINESALVEKPIRLYAKYQDSIPAIIHDLKQCAPVQNDPTKELGRLAQYAQHVVDYANDLETRGFESAEKATVQNEKYWKAIVVLSANDITALLTRLLLLMREGELRRAKIVLLFCVYDQNRTWERDSRILQEVWNDIDEIEAESDRLVEEGIRKWDKLDRKQAIELYHNALAVFPKNPWALWELGLDHMMYNLDPEEILNGEFDSRYELIREIDPHYEMAYFQGTITEDLRTAGLALGNKVLPSYSKLWKGEDVLVNMKELADGYFEMREYEFALYAYKFILFHTYVEGFDQEVIHQMSVCLKELNMDQVTPFLDEYLTALEQFIVSCLNDR